MKKLKLTNYKGITLIEIVITTVWFSICIVPMIYTYSELVSLQASLFHKYQALSLSQKNIEIVTNIAQGNWSRITNKPTNTPLILEQNPSTNFWDITPGIYKESIYETHFEFDLVCRSSNFEIVECSSPDVVAQDPNSIKIISITEWESRNNKQKIELTTNLNKIL